MGLVLLQVEVKLEIGLDKGVRPDLGHALFNHPLKSHQIEWRSKPKIQINTGFLNIPIVYQADNLHLE